jgi:hypothetical protein
MHKLWSRKVPAKLLAGLILLGALMLPLPLLARGDTEDASPAGDIPDSQVFVPFTSVQGGYALEVPEGWARTTNGADVELTSHYNGLAVSLTTAQLQPTAGTVGAIQGQKLKASGREVDIRSVKEVSLAGGPAVLMAYESDSEQEPITHKKVRLEVDSYFFYREGRFAELRMWAPKGADNIDQWQRIANSFRWQ